MSRVGKQPIKIPSGVTVSIEPAAITVNGSKGTLKQFTMEGITVNQEGDSLVVSRSSDEPKIRAKHGLMRALLANMVTGVSEGFKKELEINGVGYRVAMAGADLKLNVGFSHDVMYKVPTGVQINVNQNVITVSGIDKQQVGEAAAQIRSIKKPEPYKGKGIKYVDERVIRKAGKSGKEK